MNNRGSGAWSELGHWATTSGGKIKHQSLPTAEDDVVFDLNSFLFSGQKITLDVEAHTKNITWTNIRGASFDGNGQTLNIHGGLQAHLDLTFTGVKGLNLIFKSSGINIPVNLEARILAPNTVLTFEGGGIWELQSQIRAAANGTINLNEGTLKTNGHPISVNTFNSVGTAARTLEIGSTSIDYLSTWNINPSLNLDATGATFTLNGPNTHVFNGGGKSYKLVTFHGSNSIINQSNTFVGLSLPKADLAEGNTLTLESSQTQTVESLFTPGAGSLTTIKSSIAGQTANVNFSSFGFCTDYLTISDVTATGPGNYFAGLASTSIGTTTGWNFLNCGSLIYSPKAPTDFNACTPSLSITSTGSNTWQEIKYEGEVIAAIRDGGNILGEVSIDFAVNSNPNLALKNAEGSIINAFARNWRIRSSNQPSADKPVSIRLYGLASELEAYSAANNAVTSLSDLSFTTYSAGTTENCAYIDNTEDGAVTSYLPNATFSATGNYFTAELTGISDLTEYYLHNGTSAIDFIASQPVKEEPAVTVEEMDFTGHWNAKTVKLKWMVAGRNTASYDVEIATSLESNEFKTIITNAPRQNSNNAAVAVYHAEDVSPLQGQANYYRLKRVNLDGSFTYSQTIEVEFKPSANSVTASPNPFTNKVRVVVNAEKAGEMLVKLISEYGQVAFEKKVKISAGASETDLTLGPQVKPGIYLLTTEVNGERQTQRLIKQ
ncbi:hypothetical protein TH63_17975 [Rufibacter radiotolerans]|uniref:Por secretion system C-terminal sorting domain n=1 Tax=Rufibacter radiotolerans TaxID=1379910 RepID=A0A0H4VMK0_9BACT|nr:hypothetical protein TH63_17975 [Rufibacter radiotolerans]